MVVLCLLLAWLTRLFRFHAMGFLAKLSFAWFFCDFLGSAFFLLFFALWRANWLGLMRFWAFFDLSWLSLRPWFWLPAQLLQKWLVPLQHLLLAGEVEPSPWKLLEETAEFEQERPRDELQNNATKTATRTPQDRRLPPEESLLLLPDGLWKWLSLKVSLKLSLKLVVVLQRKLETAELEQRKLQRKKSFQKTCQAQRRRQSCSSPTS